MASDAATPGRRRPSWSSGVAIAVYRILLLVAVLVGWEIAASTFVDPMWTSKPTDIGERLWDLARAGSLPEDVGTTALELVIGVTAGTIVGVLVAFALGMNRSAADIFRPLVTLGYSFPQLAIAPLYILWFGIYMTPKIVLVAVVVFFIMFITVFEGLRQVDVDLVNTLRVMGAARRHVLRMVVLPSILLFISTGLKSAVPFGLRAAIFAEILISTKGLGHILQGSAELLDSTGMFAALFLIMAVGVTLTTIVNLQERFSSRWRPQPSA